jgi:GDP-L-fucose synthase
MFFASSCIFPKESLQPIKEEYLLTGPLEQTNESYSIAKIAGIKLCEAYRKQYGCNFISVNPCNVYGPGDKFDPMKGHVMSSLIYKIWKAHKENQSEVICFGDGSPEREFIHVNDLADASIFLMNSYNEPDIINIGTGVDYTIKKIAETIKEMVGYSGNLIWDTTKPNGMIKKVLDVSKLNSLGWQSKINLNDGIESVLNYLEKNP